MKKKGIIISIIGILLVSTLTIILISKNSKKHVMYDGMMLAMTLTDSSGNTTTITEFPSGTNYTVEVDCGDTATERWLGEEWKLSVEDIKGNVKCNISFYARTDSDKLSNIVQNSNPINNNGYRYSGKIPDNYIWFNNEMWRIIGLVPTCIEASNGTCSTATNLVKIIRNESIGGLAYDAKKLSTETGLWGSNTLYSLLNEYYYGKQNGTGTDYCYGYGATVGVDCDYANIGISSSSDYYGQMIEEVYWNIGASDYSATPETVYGTESAVVTTDTAPIGLMSASDYGYAAEIDGYSTNLSLYNTSAITGTNWLYGQGYERTNIQSSSIPNGSLYVNPNGNVSNAAACLGYVIRPVLYLDAGVYKISGSGTMADSYIIGM